MPHSVYMNYARSHIQPGFELGFMCVVFYVLQGLMDVEINKKANMPWLPLLNCFFPFPLDCIDCNMGAMTWGTWLVSSSLIFSPFWFNPLTFSTSKVSLNLIMICHNMTQANLNQQISHSALLGAASFAKCI